MLKPLPKERKFSGIEQVQMLTQTAEREKEIHRLQHELNASKIECQSNHQDWLNECEKNKELHDEYAQKIVDNIKLKGEIKKLQSALEYYANIENYKHIPLFKTANVLIEKGEFARYVLGGRTDGRA